MILETLKNPASAPVKENLRHQKIMWSVERAGWVLMSAIVIAALAGLFGGPTTRKEAQDGSGRLQMVYQHFQRHLKPSEVQLSFEACGQSVIEITLDAALFSAFEIRGIMPQPLETQTHAGGLLMKFAASPESEAPARITLIVVPNGQGRVSGHIGFFGETPAPLDIFVFP